MAKKVRGSAVALSNTIYDPTRDDYFTISGSMTIPNGEIPTVDDSPVDVIWFGTWAKAPGIVVQYEGFHETVYTIL